MMIEKDQTGLDAIINNFDAPKLFLDRTIKAGPDEILYLMHDNENHKFAVWSRDYMSELEYEAIGLEKNEKIKVVKWFALKNSDDYETIDEGSKYYCDGDWYAIGLIE